MLTEARVADYRRDGVLVVPEVLDTQELMDLRRVIDEIVAGAANVEANTDVYDLEPTHTRAMPRVRRIKAPTNLHPIFSDVLRRPRVLAILQALIGPALRMHGSKLNMKAAQYGSPVEWHQDWAFYPHTNDDILAIGVMLDDTDLENGAMLVSPGTHTGPIWNHHGEDGRFRGMIDPDEIHTEIARAVPCVGRAGSMSFHHVRALHGSALNTSNRSRNLLLYEVAAADAWPLLGVKDFDVFNSLMIQGAPTIEPRVMPVPVRMPLPPALRQGSIYEISSRPIAHTFVAWRSLIQGSAGDREEASPTPQTPAWDGSTVYPPTGHATTGRATTGPVFSVVVPMFNEADGILLLHIRLTAVMDGLGEPWEVVYVNDGSRDTTLPIVEDLRGRDSHVAVVNLSRNFGKEIATTAGLDHARGAAVIVIDADLQDPPEVIPELVAAWREGFDMVYARRRVREGDTWLKSTTAALFYRLMRNWGQVELPSDTGDFRLMSRRAVDALLQLREQHRFMKGLFAWVGFPSKPVLYDRAPRAAGATKWSYWKLWNLAIEGFTSFSVLPLKLATYIGIAVASVAALFGLVVVVRTLVRGDSPAGYPSLLVVVLLLGGTQLIFLGVIGEYLGRVFNETKQRPLYLVERYLPSRPATTASETEHQAP